ncbi:MAG: hypothetical protein ACUVUG_06775 [Candidatus Aminicenantia bacterium]
MKRILIVSFYFPPFLNMRAIRASKISKYLEREGWEVHVLSADGLNLEKGLPVEVREDRVKRVPFSKGSKSFSIPSRLKKSKILRKFINYQDRFLKWFLEASFFGRKLLKKEKIPLILSFSPPYPANLLASRLSKEFNIPWIAEFGDLWAENYYLKRIFPISLFEKVIERIVLKSASSLISVSDQLCKRLKEIHKKDVFLFPHFFDDEDYNLEIKPSKNFTLTYTGHLYPYQNFEIFLSALKALKKDNLLENAEVRFYSYNYMEIKKWFKNYSDLPIKVNPPVPYSESMKVMKESTSLIFFCLKDQNLRENPMKGKIFSYLGSARPVLVIGEDAGGVLLKKTGVGKICVREEDVKETIKEWKSKFEKGKELLSLDYCEINRYSYKSKIMDLSNFLEGFIK